MSSETMADDGLSQVPYEITTDSREDIDIETKEHFGDKVKKINQEETLRIGFVNINGLPPTTANPKNRNIYNAITNKQIGILGLSEVNKCWHLMKEKDKWRNRTRGWWECSHNVFGYNRNDSDFSSVFQPGGTANISIGNTSHRVLKSGTDSTGLGRWVWTLYKGKHNVTLRVISAYRACKPSCPGPNTAYNQQLRYLNRHGDSRCPRTAFLDDLGQSITNWLNNGDQIVLMADFNEDVEGQKIQEWTQQLQLSNAIAQLHQLRGEPTFHRGKTSIDGIYISHSIHPNKGGYMPFGAFPTDHRCLWIDVSMINAFGYNPPKSAKFSARRLKSDNPATRNKWLRIYENFIRLNHLHIRQFQLEASITNFMNPAQIAEYEDIRKIRLAGIKIADRGCRKLTMGNVPFSDKYKEITDKIELWRAVITKKKKCRYSQSKLRRLEKTTGISNSLHFSLEEAMAKEKAAFQEYWEFKRKSREMRTTFLENKAKDMEKESNTNKKTILLQIITREKQREASRRIKLTLNKIRKQGITKVDIENAQGEIEEITTKQGIEEACMEENRHKFLQTRDTPCMREPLRSLLGRFGNTEFAHSILQGQCTPPTTTPQYTQELFQQLKQAEYTTQPPTEYISKSTFQTGWRKMKEYTSSGISGLHFGHLKTCAMREFTAQFESSLSHIPYLTGYSPVDWNFGVNVMIQKKDKIDLVTKLRTITLTEADFNFNNKFLGKQTLEHAENNNLIAKEQYGSRKGKSAIEHSVHKRLTFDIMRQMRTDGALCSNDAKSCYDRIIHSIASLAYQRLGVPFPPVKCMLQSIQNMKHHIRTSFGDSRFTMSNNGTLIPFQGALQGNGASPATWVIISTPLLNMLREAGNGGYFIEPISKTLSHFVGYAFVDDTDLIQFDARDQNMSTEEVMDKMQDAINRWEGGLKATGGAIVPQKSFVYPISFDFNDAGDWRYKSTDEIDFNFTVPDHENNVQPLNQLEVYDSKCTLGVHLAPDGNNKEAVRQLRLKSEEWCAYIKSGHLNRHDAWLATESTIMKSLLYPLAALTLTEKECNHIMAPVLDAGLRNSAICKNFPRAVAYGPKEEGGLNLPNLYTQQGLIKIGMIQDHLGEPNMTGDLLRNSIEAAKIEVGVGRNIFSLDYNQFGTLLTDTWIKDVWKFSQEHNIEIMDKVTKNLQLHRHNDVFIMEIMVNQGFSKSELKKINKCRLYLQVTSLADITCGYGNKFTKAYNCILDDNIPHYYNWPRQPRPNGMAIKIWRKALRECFSRSNGIMDYTLGRWLYRPSSNWKWYYSALNQLVYQKQGLIWRIWRRSSRGGNLGRTPRYKYDTNGFHRDILSVRATVTRQGHNNLILTGWSEHDNGEPFTFTEHNDTDWVLANKTQPQNAPMLIEAITNGTAVAVSDGSFLDSRKAGTASWIIEDTSQTRQATGSVECPGPPEAQCSHRSELMGLLGIISHVNQLCKAYNVQDGAINIGCDGKGAIQIIQAYAKCTSSHKHFDLISSIRASIANSNVKWKFCHIKGHQDDILEYEELNRLEQLNIATDLMAKEKLSAMISTPLWERRRPTHLPYEKVEVYWTNRCNTRVKISSTLTKTLTNKIQTKAIRKYWIKKSKFSSHNESYIDWITSQKSRTSLPTYRQRWLSKWMTGFCGTGSKLKIYRFQNHSKCPRCEIDNEDTNHVLRCQQHEALALWSKSVEDLERWMLETNGHPELVELILLGLNTWHRNNRIPLTYEILEPDLKKAWTKQRRIGWRSFIEGFWVIEWRACQEQYLQHINSRKSSTLWISRVQRRIWLIAWNMWEHRNNYLHNDGRTIHSFDTKALNEEIKEEWTLGLDQLDPSYSHLFKGHLNERIEDNVSNKLMWISSVWSARDNDITIGPIRSRNRIIINLYERWKKKNAIDD